MRNVTSCRLDLRPDADTEAFERAVLRDVFPAAGDRPREADWLFVRSLYRSREPGEFPAYACLVYSEFAGDSNFHGMRRPLTDLGATVSRPPRFWPLFADLPDDDVASAQEAAEHQLLMVVLGLPLDRNSADFEAMLVEALTDDIGTGPTRTNHFTAVRVFRDDSTDIPDTEYLCKATGSFMQPHLFAGTVERIREAGARILRSTAYTHIGSLSGGAFRPPGWSGAPGAPGGDHGT